MGADHGIQGAEARVVQRDVLFGNAPLHQSLPHRRRLIVKGRSVVSAHQNLLRLPRLIKFSGGVHSTFEEQVPIAVLNLGRGAQNKGDGLGGKLVGLCINSAAGTIQNRAVGGPDKEGGAKNEEPGPFQPSSLLSRLFHAKSLSYRFGFAFETTMIPPLFLLVTPAYHNLIRSTGFRD